MASQMLGLAFFKAGLYPQCYSVFGGERRGAPVVSFLRVDKKKVLLKCDIKHPDELLYFDPSLINTEEMQAQVLPGARILVSAHKLPEPLKDLSGYTVGLIDAAAIADRLGLGHVTNTTVLGAYCRLTTHFSIEHLVKAVHEMVPAKKESNIEALRQGFENIEIIPMEE